MDRMTTVLVTIFSILCLWLGENAVEGKCRGLWKNNHACLGGNGKRSDPSLVRDNDESVTLLDTILRANAMPPSESDPYVQKNDFRPLTDYGRNPERNRDRYTTKLEELIRKLIQVLRQDEDSKK